jgi:hypothetical protein
MERTPVSSSNRTPVKSSNIASVGYDPATRELEVEFKGGKGKPGSGPVYRYADVPQETYDQFMGHDSKGAFHHGHIKGKFSHTKL